MIFRTLLVLVISSLILMDAFAQGATIGRKAVKVSVTMTRVKGPVPVYKPLPKDNRPVGTP